MMTRNEEIKLVLGYINNPKRLKAVLETLDDSAFSTIISRFTDLSEEIKLERQIEREEAAKAEEKRLEMIAYLQSQGWTPEQLINPAKAQTKPTKQKSAAKYQFTNKSGQVKFWSGFGRTPRELQELLDDGASLADFLVQDKG